MDFYAAQDHARRQTRRLVVLFVCAVLLLVLLTNLIVMAALGHFDASLSGHGGEMSAALRRPFDWHAFTLVSLGVCAGVGGAMLWKTLQLASGGKAIARLLGGDTPLSPDSNDPGERRLLNVVEEMAIAAALPVPPVYVIPEAAINAFAAGFAVEDAVIGVTRGAVEQLDRDELQGVIGHEFSHILNGDMRLNMRLLAMLNGILFIGNAGRILLRATSDRGAVRIDSRRGNGNSLALVGLALLLLGACGVFFGRLIKAGVSRQREFLADASAVQFTRNPQGLADALKRIGGMSVQGRLHSPRAEEASHLFFADGVGSALGSLLATHPPLEKRIRRLDPQWRGAFLEQRSEPIPDDEAPGVAGLAAAAAVPPASSVAPPVSLLPDDLRAACRDRERVCALMLACLRRADTAPAPGDAALDATLAGLDAGGVLALLELSMPALKALDPAPAQAFRAAVESRVQADDRLSIGEIVIVSLLARHLWHDGPRAAASAPRFRQLAQVESALSLLLSAIAWGCHADPNPAQAALAAAARELALPSLRLVPGDGLRWRVVDGALGRLRGLFPLLKPRVLKGCRAVLQTASPDAAYAAAALRAIASAIDCPLDSAIV